MMQKVEKLLDLAIECAEMYLGRAKSGEVAMLAEKAVKTRAKKTPTPPPAEQLGHALAGHKPEPGGSPFDPPAAAVTKLSAEESLEAGRRGQEVMGLFIRRFLKANPTGLERAKKVINETLGLPRVPATAWKLEDFTPEDWLKLTPKFEAELEKAA